MGAEGFVMAGAPCHRNSLLFEDIFLLCRLSRRQLGRLLVTRASPKHLATLTLRRAAKTQVLSAVSKRLIVKTERGLIQSSDILEKSRAKYSSSGTPANSRNNLHSNKLSSNECDNRWCGIFGRGPRRGGNSYLRYPCLKNFFHNCLITNDLKATKA